MTTDEHTPDRPCATCAAPLADGQDWCLECGSAQPGRLGGRPGWRAALTVVGACALLATGAGAAAYAALSSEAQRVAAAPPPPAAAPTVPPPAPVPAPPAEEVPLVEAPDSEPADEPEPEAPADDGTADVPADDGAAAGAGGTGTGDDEEQTDEQQPIDLSVDAASTYDPEERGGNAVGDPADAVDGRDDTAWEAPVGADGEVRVGLVVSLEEARALSRLVFQADTPGFTVETYGSRATKLPPDVLDARWETIGTRRDVGVRERVNLGGKYRHVLLWITAQPADTKVAISEIQLFDQGT